MLDKRIRQQLLEMCRGDIRFDEPMARHTSFGVGGPADVFFYPSDLDEARQVCGVLARHGVPVLPIGDGTNLLVGDPGWRGAAICLTRSMRAISFQEGVGSAEAGASLSVFSRQCQRAGLGGMEFACSIPGTVGGGVRGNAGAFGGETWDRLRTIEALELKTGEILHLTKADVPHGYRRCDFPPDLLLLSVAFELVPDRPEDVQARMEEVLDRRRATQPLYERNAGCVFKNPAETSAGLLIDQAGCKGLSVGRAVVSDLHANFIVNRGGATAADVLRLIDLVRDRVRKSTGVNLQIEIRIAGEGPGISGET